MIARFLSAPLLVALIAIGIGTGIDALIKGIAPSAGLLHLLAWRFLFGGLIALIVFRHKKLAMPGREAIGFHTMRGLIQLATAFLFFYALMHLRLAEATIIGFTAALMVPPIARVLLGEKITSTALAATVIGFVGAAIAISDAPSQINASPDRTLGLIACFAAAFLYAIVLVLLRMRATKEDAVTIAMFTNVVPAIALLPISVGAIMVAAIPGSIPGLTAPDWTYMPYFLMFGALGYCVWLLMTLAYARAPAQRLAPLEYTSLIWSALLGIAFFSETPGWRLWVGAIIIIAACLIVALENHFHSRRQAQMPLSDLPE